MLMYPPLPVPPTPGLAGEGAAAAVVAAAAAAAAAAAVHADPYDIVLPWKSFAALLKHTPEEHADDLNETLTAVYNAVEAKRPSVAHANTSTMAARATDGAAARATSMDASTSEGGGAATGVAEKMAGGVKRGALGEGADSALMRTSSSGAPIPSSEVSLTRALEATVRRIAELERELAAAQSTAAMANKGGGGAGGLRAGSQTSGGGEGRGGGECNDGAGGSKSAVPGIVLDRFATALAAPGPPVSGLGPPGVFGGGGEMTNLLIGDVAEAGAKEVVGIEEAADREAALSRYRDKRERRTFNTIKYAVRKEQAQGRQRGNRGRFLKGGEDVDGEKGEDEVEGSKGDDDGDGNKDGVEGVVEKGGEGVDVEKGGDEVNMEKGGDEVNVEKGGDREKEMGGSADGSTPVHPSSLSSAFSPSTSDIGEKAAEGVGAQPPPKRTRRR
jgi:hypothetical protein